MTEEKVFASGGFHKPADRTPSEAKQAPLPGDRFQSVQSVGRGRWSEVYQAIDITTNEMVAVKLVMVAPAFVALTCCRYFVLALHRKR